MTLTTRTLPSYTVFDEQGRPWVGGTGRKVVEIAIDRRALAYCFDHQAELDAEIARMESFVQETRAQNPPTVTREILQARLVDGKSQCGRG
jgi:hypothetical protein